MTVIRRRVMHPRQLVRHPERMERLWIVTRSCGVRGLEEELALDAEGDIVYG